MGKVVDFYTGKETSKQKLNQENEFFLDALQEVITGFAQEDVDYLRKMGYETLTSNQKMALNSIKKAKRERA